MNKEKGLEFLYASKLAPLLKKPEVTDISYNGKEVFYVENMRGRMRYDMQPNEQEMRDFIRQIANICEKQFSYTSPELDVTIDRYRINATHPSIGKVYGDDTITFSIRIASERIKIYDDRDFLSEAVEELFDVLLQSHQSIMIGGLPGSGKTELQKYLLTRIDYDQRVILVDNICELEVVRNSISYDLTTWQYDEKNTHTSLPKLIKNALRNNPDWLILAEGRGKEMSDIIMSAITGLPIISTIHSIDGVSIPTRMARLAMQKEERFEYDDLLKDIYYHFHYFVYLRKRRDRSGIYRRYIASIIEYDNEGNHHEIYADDLQNRKYHCLFKDNKSLLSYGRDKREFIKEFIGEENE